MKSKNLVIVAVILLLLLLGLGGFLMLSNNKQTAPKTTVTKEVQTPVKTENTNTQTLIDLLKSGKNLRCTFSVVNTEGGSSEGTVYLAGTKMRGDIKATSKDGKQQEFSMIKTGDTNYIWGPAIPMGIKMTLSLDKISENSQTGKYFSQKTDYKCTNWATDESLFIPPTNVKFTDMSGLLPNTTTMPTKTQTGGSETTNPCSQITNPTARAACESALQKIGQ